MRCSLVFVSGCNESDGDGRAEDGVKGSLNFFNLLRIFVMELMFTSHGVKGRAEVYKQDPSVGSVGVQIVEDVPWAMVMASSTDLLAL